MMYEEEHQLSYTVITFFKYFIEIVELPMDVSTNSDWCLNTLQIGFLKENLLDLVADLLDHVLRRAFQLPDFL